MNAIPKVPFEKVSTVLQSSDSLEYHWCHSCNILGRHRQKCAETATSFEYSSQDISGMISWGTGGEVPLGKEQTLAEHTLQEQQMEDVC